MHAWKRWHCIRCIILIIPERQSSRTLSTWFWRYLLQSGVLPFCSEESLHSVMPVLIAPCIGLSAVADHCYAALSSVVFSKFSLLILILLISCKLNLEIYLSLLNFVSSKGLRWLWRHTHTHTVRHTCTYIEWSQMRSKWEERQSKR